MLLVLVYKAIVGVGCVGYIGKVSRIR